MATYQAIITKYFPASNVKGSHVKVSAAAGSITLHYDSGLNGESNHAEAAEALAKNSAGLAAGRWAACRVTPATASFAAAMAMSPPSSRAAQPKPLPLPSQPRTDRSRG